jgi:hypothetical protein
MNDDHLRMSDAERERAANELGEHYAEGRIDRVEHAERLDRIWAARTRGELGPIFRDLPGQGYGRGLRAPGPPVGAPFGPGGPPPAHWAPPGRVSPWHRRVPTPLVAMLGVLMVITVLSNPHLVVLALVVWFLLRQRRGAAGARRHPGGPGGWHQPWPPPGR